MADFAVRKSGLRRFVELSREVSVRFALTQSLCGLEDLGRIRLEDPLTFRLFSYRDKLVNDFVIRELQGVLESWYDRPETGKPFSFPARAPVWMFWLQGIDEAPPYQRGLIDRSVELCSENAVTVLSLESVNDYTSVPGFVFDKYRSGEISIQMLSDIVRYSLLRDNGGIWLDATVYMARPIPTDVLLSPFYTAKGIRDFPGSYRYFNILNWEGYFLAGWKGATFFGFMADALLTYWRRNEFQVQYLLANYIAAIGLARVAAIRSAYERIPVNNTLVERLSWVMLEGTRLTPELEQEFFYGDTFVYKLPYREYPRGTREGVELLSDRVFS